MLFKHRTMLMCVVVIAGVYSQFLAAQHAFKILVDNNQIYPAEFNNAHRLKCDGIWSIPGNSTGNWSRDTPISQWQIPYNHMGPGWVCTEDYWMNFPAKNYDLTADIIGDSAIHMVCVYAEPGRNDGIHETTICSDSVIQAVHDYTGKPIVVITRAYWDGKWKDNAIRALNNPLVGGVCYESKPDPAKLESNQMIALFRTYLDSGKKALLLLSPHFRSESTNYTADNIKVYEYIKSAAPDILDHPEFYFVFACYNRLKDKSTTMLGDEDSVEGSIKKFMEIRENGGLTSVQDPNASLSGFALRQNHPNPFNPSTVIRYHLSAFSRVRIDVVDLNGRLVARLLDEGQVAGEHQVIFDGSGLASGVYYTKMDISGDGRTFTGMRKMILMR